MTMEELKAEVDALKARDDAWAKDYLETDRGLRRCCLAEACRRHENDDVSERILEYMRLYGGTFTPFVDPDLMFAGTPGHYSPFRGAKSGHLWSDVTGITSDRGHYCADYEKMVRVGVKGVRAEVEAATPKTDEQRMVKAAMLEALDLFKAYILKHADEAARTAKRRHMTPEQVARMNALAADLNYIATEPPVTMKQGLQLILLTHSYVMFKTYTDTITFGNLDRMLDGLYEKEKRAGTLDKMGALEEICHFCLALSRMIRDTQNIVLGGSNADGSFFENDLTVLFLKAQTLVHYEQPSVSLKIRPETSDAVWDAALDLLAKGGGMPSFLNDKRYIEALVKSGFSREDANTFVNVGCYEATPYGNTFGATISGAVQLVKIFAAFFAKKDDYASFDDFLAGWEKYLTDTYMNELLPEYIARRESIEKYSASPFAATLFDGCIEKLAFPEKYGAKYNIHSVLFGGLGTITDCLSCVKHFVFDTHTYTLAQLRDAVESDWQDAGMLAAVRAYPDRFGCGSEFTDKLASREADFMHRLAFDHPFGPNIMTTALFLFTEDIYTVGLPATPDGRKTDDRYSYGAAAAELLPRRDVTKVLMSTAQLPLDEFPIGAPMTVNITADTLATAKGRKTVREMIATFLEQGGTHIQINVADPEVLRDAQKHPEKYKDLLIRISGHTEPFTRLNPTMQNALIARAEMGC